MGAVASSFAISIFFVILFAFNSNAIHRNIKILKNLKKVHTGYE